MNEEEFRLMVRLLLSQAPLELCEELQALMDKVLRKYMQEDTGLFPIIISSSLHKWLEGVGLHLPLTSMVSEN